MKKTRCVICGKWFEQKTDQIVACSFTMLSKKISNLSTWNACNKCHEMTIKPKIITLLRTMGLAYGNEEVMPNADHK